jgi:hypothetical protein
MTALWITLAAIPVIMVITIVAIIVAARRHGPAIVAAQREFFIQTGFQHPERLNQPLEAQVAYVPRRGDLRTMKIETRYVRPLPTGEQILFDATATTEAGKRVHRQAWRLALRQPPTAVLQIADRHLSSTGKAVREHLTGAKRTWRAVYPGPFPTGDAELDARFHFYSPDPDTARRLLARPGLRERLLACEEVDLTVSPGEIAFADPADENMKAARGGTIGRMSHGLNAAPSILASIPVHQRVTAILEEVHVASA